MAIDESKATWVIHSIQKGRTLKSCFEELDIDPHEFFEVVWGSASLTGLYERAQKSRAEILVEEIVDIADSEPDSSRAKNRLDARRWYASKMIPHKYGDRVDVNITQTVSITAALEEAKRRTLIVNETKELPDIELKSDPKDDDIFR